MCVLYHIHSETTVVRNADPIRKIFSLSHCDHLVSLLLSPNIAAAAAAGIKCLLLSVFGLQSSLVCYCLQYFFLLSSIPGRSSNDCCLVWQHIFLAVICFHLILSAVCYSTLMSSCNFVSFAVPGSPPAAAAVRQAGWEVRQQQKRPIVLQQWSNIGPTSEHCTAVL